MAPGPDTLLLPSTCFSRAIMAAQNPALGAACGRAALRLGKPWQGQSQRLRQPDNWLGALGRGKAQSRVAPTRRVAACFKGALGMERACCSNGGGWGFSTVRQWLMVDDPGMHDAGMVEDWAGMQDERNWREGNKRGGCEVLQAAPLPRSKAAWSNACLRFVHTAVPFLFMPVQLYTLCPCRYGWLACTCKSLSTSHSKLAWQVPLLINDKLYF